MWFVNRWPAGFKRERFPRVGVPAPHWSDRTRLLAAAVHLANDVVFRASQERFERRGMGTTIVACLGNGSRLSVVHVGDSRFYLFRGGKLLTVTRDHSLVAEQVAQGLISSSEAETSESKNILTRALGVGPRWTSTPWNPRFARRHGVALYRWAHENGGGRGHCQNPSRQTGTPCVRVKPSWRWRWIAAGRDNVTVAAGRVKREGIFDRLANRLRLKMATPKTSRTGPDDQTSPEIQRRDWSKNSRWINRKFLWVENPGTIGDRQPRRVRKALPDFKEGAGYFVEDLKSTNGTFIRDRRVEREPLHHNDVLAIAKHTVEFFNDEEVPVRTANGRGARVVGRDRDYGRPSRRAQTVPTGGPSPYAGRGGRSPDAADAIDDVYREIGPGSGEIKGLFAPDLAACVSKKSDGYHLTALKEKSVKLNGDVLMDQADVPLKEGDLIDVGNLKLLFFLQDPA
jgi:hypothetical protein